MPYVYECRQCGAHSPRQHARSEDAETEQEQHRADSHGGLAPAAGDGVRRVHAEARGDGCLPSGSFWAALFFLAVLLANCWGR